MVDGKHGPEHVTNTGAGDITALNDRKERKELHISVPFLFHILAAWPTPFLPRSGTTRGLVQPKVICIL